MITVLFYQNALSVAAIAERSKQLPLLVQQRIAKRKRVRAKLDSLAGYLLLQRGLEARGEQLEQLYFSPVGKPMLKNTSTSFSISHNAGWVGVCLADKGTIGIDLQAHRTFDPIESAFAFFSTTEQVAILQSPDPNSTLIQYWSKKEALIKAGGGRMFDEAALTDTTKSHCLWKGTTYYWQEVPTVFDGAIWIAASFAPEKISQKKLAFL